MYVIVTEILFLPSHHRSVQFLYSAVSLFSKAVILFVIPAKTSPVAVQIFFFATGSLHVPTVKNTEMKNENRSSNSVFQCLAKTKEKNRKLRFEFRFFNAAGERKTKIEVRIPFFNVVQKRKTKTEVRIPFSNVAGKRLALRYTHSKKALF